MTEKDPAFRSMFTRDSMLRSAWYASRIEHQQRLDVAGWNDRVKYLRAFIDNHDNRAHALRLNLEQRLDHAQRMLDKVSAPAWRDRLVGTIGVDPTLAG
jgi:phosphoenolpyruvate carboxykinase (diphosphate)